MKKILLFLLLLPLFAQAQIVTTNPAFPTEDGAVDIIFDATQGTAGLKGYTGDVYAHTGVNTNLGNWKSAPTWLDNSDKYKLTPLGNNKWKLSITPSIRAYYDKLLEGEKVLQLAFVFRNATGSLEGKDTGSKDIFVNVYQTGLNISFATPTTSQLLDKDATLSITANSSFATNLRLLLGETEIKTATNATTISTSHKFTAAGGYWLIAEAGVAPNTVRDSVFVNVKKDQVVEARPAKVRAGINIINDNTATFVLFAPGKSNVFLIGDFNNWLISNDYMMKKDGDYWWITLSNLEKGKEYAFQYLVDGSLRIADPYADKVLDPWNDQYIPETVYPNLKKYPVGKTDQIVSIVQTGQTPYNWKVTDFAAPAKEKLVIYELLVRDFTEQHSFNATLEKLDYLQTLGINAIELLPINEFEGNSSWGYNPSFYFAVDKYYGTKDAFKAFVDECHRRGIAVIIDMVLNHSYGQSPFVRLYWDSVNNRPAANNPWYNVTSPNTSYSWGSDFNHESAYTKQLVDSVNSYWMSEYKVDGFRFDFTKGFTNTPGDGWAFDQARINILKRMTSEIYKRNPDAYVIFEHLADNSEETVLANADIMLWGNMSGNYSEAIMGYTESSKTNLSWGLYSNRGWSKPNLIAYMESHDEERMMFKAKTWGKVTDLPGAALRAQLCAAFYLTLPGPKMIWQFGEVGYDYSINTCSDGITISDNCRLAEKPIRWDFIDDTDRRGIYDMYAKLNTLKHEYPVFNTSDISYSLIGGQKYFVWKSSDMNAFVVGNFDVTPMTVSVTLPKSGTWYSTVDETSINLASTSYSETLQGGEFRMYTDKKVVSSIDVPTSEENGVIITNDLIRLLDSSANIVTIYDMQGIMHKKAIDESEINISNLNKGTYIIKVQKQNTTTVYKFIKR